MVSHLPVMTKEVTEALSPRDGEIFVDATFGGGGHSKALLEAADCTVWGLDRDPEAMTRGRHLAANYAGRLNMVLGRFSEMDALLVQHGVNQINGVAFDLGVSSFQIDSPERGFSFQLDGPLDMRMSASENSALPSAAEVVNKAAESALADILFRFGEERKSRRIAKAIVAARTESPITRTLELADIIRRAVGPGGRGKPKAGGKGARIHPATRSFQALRIYVNDELGELDRGLASAERLLAPEGRLVVISFHSLEDRRVKQFIRSRSGHSLRASRHSPLVAVTPLRDVGRAPSFKTLFRRAKRPGEAETNLNPRARSARLRAAVRTDAPAWELEAAA